MAIRRLVPWVFGLCLSAAVAFAAIAVLITLRRATGTTPELQRMTGYVTCDGRPQADWWVKFSPLSGGRPSVARTDQSGRYELHYARQTGALLGRHQVTIGSGGQTDDRGNVLAPAVTLLTEEVEVRPAQ